MPKRLILGSTFVLMLFSPVLVTAACPGDCNDNGTVTVDELVVGVNIALDRATVERCASLDANDDGHVMVNEIITAVNALLGGCPEGRLIALSRDGHMASLGIASPWPVRKSIELGAVISSARCRAGRCLVVHPSPADKISVVDAADLSLSNPIELERDADPRDVALVDDHTAVVSQYGKAELLVVDLTTRAMTPIDLTELADDDGLPEALQMANCGRRVFVQLRRVDHESDAPAAIGAALAVVDLDRPSGDQIVDADPVTRGIQGIALAGRPKFDMPIECGTGMLYVAEPAPLFQGGGGYEQVDLDTLSATDLPIDTGAEVGGFEVVGPGQFWIITHTDTGPGASSHLNLIGGTSTDTYNTFADEHINDLAFDPEQDLLFFPDACVIRPNNQSCDSGIHVFAAHTGPPQIASTIKVGFAPIEITLAR
jgi:hypothetical protein